MTNATEADTRSKANPPANPTNPTSPTDPLPTELRWPTPMEFLRLRCPVCWQGAMFHSPLGMNPSCDHCGHTFDRGNGYFLGAMFASYTIVVVFEAVLIGALRAAGLDWLTVLVAGAASIPIIGPLVAFPYSRVMWVMSERRLLRWGEDEDAALRDELGKRRASRDGAPPGK